MKTTYKRYIFYLKIHDIMNLNDRGNFMRLFMDLLDQTLESIQIKEIEHFVKSNVISFFNSPFLAKYYQKLKPYPLEFNEGRLVIAWLAFLSGDNMAQYESLLSIDFNELDDKMKALYLDLKAISRLFGTLDERYQLSLESLKYSKSDDGFYKANSLAIHANLIYSIGKLRDAASLFGQAYHIFFRDKLYFQASVALTNELIILARLGEFNEVITKGKHTLMLTSLFQSDDKIYWESIYMPLGIVYFMQNKPSLALECLKKAEIAIDLMDLVHMHGILEIYLIKAYLLNKDIKGIRDLMDKTCKNFMHTALPTMETVIAFGKIVSNHPQRKSEIERIEELISTTKPIRPLLLEVASYAIHQGLLDIDIHQDLVKMIETTRYQGDMIGLQIGLLFLAEHYYKMEDFHASKVLLEEAISYYYKLQLKAPFHIYEYKCAPLISKIDKKIITNQSKNEYSNLLTQKELDILNLIAQGKNNEDIGKTIFISTGTVKWHINHILSKLDVKNRIQAVEKAKALKLID